MKESGQRRFVRTKPLSRVWRSHQRRMCVTTGVAKMATGI